MINVVFIAFLLFSPSLSHPYGCRTERKEKQIQQIISSSSNFSALSKIIPILKKYPNTYRYIPTLYPVNPAKKTWVSSPFGYRNDPINGNKKLHEGIDIVSEFATPIYACADGRISFSGDMTGYGKCVIIEHKFGFQSLYGHLSGIYKKRGASVSKGTIIGFLGSSGRSTGNHLHFQIQKNGYILNPLYFISKDNKNA